MQHVSWHFLSTSEKIHGKTLLLVLSLGAEAWIEGSHFTSHLMARVERKLRKPVAFLTKKDLDSRLFGIRPMGAIDRVYRFLCCITLGDAAKNGQNGSTNSESKSIGSQGRGLGPTSPSSSQSSWCGFLQGERKSKNTFSSENGKPEQQKHITLVKIIIPFFNIQKTKKKPSQKSATDQRDQSPQPLRQRAGRGTLLGIEGHRIKDTKR